MAKNMEATEMSIYRELDKTWCIRTMDCYPVLKRNEILTLKLG